MQGAHLLEKKIDWRICKTTMNESIYHFLKQMQEPLPEWLAACHGTEGFRIEDFFRSRTVFYPGSGTDGHPVKLFNSTCSAHCFIYADYLLSEDRIKEELESKENGFLGYHIIFEIRLPLSQVSYTGKVCHLTRNTLDKSKIFHPVNPYAFVTIMERDKYIDDIHGAERIAILFLGMDGISSFDIIYCQKGSHSPFAVFLQDHGYGANYTTFGAGGLLERLAISQESLPDWLVMGEGTKPWSDYERVSNVNGDAGGMHSMIRNIYKRQSLG